MNDTTEQSAISDQHFALAGAENPPSGRCRPACPACGGSLIEIRAKLQCSECHTICETCCEGGRG